MSINELDMRVDKIRSLKRLIEEAEAEITCKVTWRQVSSTRIDSKGLKKNLPDIAAQYSATTSYRRFLIT